MPGGELSFRSLPILLDLLKKYIAGQQGQIYLFSVQQAPSKYIASALESIGTYFG